MKHHWAVAFFVVMSVGLGFAGCNPSPDSDAKACVESRDCDDPERECGVPLCVGEKCEPGGGDAADGTSCATAEGQSGICLLGDCCDSACDDQNACTFDYCNSQGCVNEAAARNGRACGLAGHAIRLCVEGSGDTELCTGGEDEDGDELIDCDDVYDCACTDACIEGFLEACSPTNLLANPGFEEGPTGISWDPNPGFPTAPDIWGGDLADVVGEVSGITPLEGVYMMQFQSTFNQPVPTESSSSERVQLIDASGLFGSRICGVASFARVSGDGETDNRFAVVTAWYDGVPADFDGFTSHITTQCFEEDRCGNSQVDIDPDSWVRAASTTDLPDQGAVTAVVMLRAQENVYNDTDTDAGSELDGHFVDDVRLFVVPQACP